MVGDRESDIYELLKRQTATTEVRIGKVQLQPPQKRAQDGPVTAWLVRVLETSTPPAG